jgi:hypothetical protein
VNRQTVALQSDSKLFQEHCCSLISGPGLASTLLHHNFCSLLPLAIDLHILFTFDTIGTRGFLCTFPKTFRLLHLSAAATILVWHLGWCLLNFMPARVCDCGQKLLTHPALTRQTQHSFLQVEMDLRTAQMSQSRAIVAQGSLPTLSFGRERGLAIISWNELCINAAITRMRAI